MALAGLDLAEPTAETLPIVRIWERLARPFNTLETVDALAGLPQNVVRQFAGMTTAASAEARELLARMPKTIRSLATSMEANTVRCRGELRGPVLWSETISARSATNGDEDLFVCAAPTRAYDITENRVLVAAIDTIRQAALDAQAVSLKAYDDDRLREARAAGEQAKLYLQHPSLRSIPAESPSGRAVKRTRAGKSRKTYEPALAMLSRASEPLDALTLYELCDQRTRAQHSLLMALVHKLEEGGSRLPLFRAEEGVLFAGPLQYHHPRKRGSRARLSGIVLGSLLIDVPDRIRESNRLRAEQELQARAQGRHTFVVMERSDVARAVARAIELARG